MPEDEPYFSRQINRLFETKRKPDGTLYSMEDVIRGTNGLITRVYLWKLRGGKATNPIYKIISAFASFFHVDPGYFFPPNVESDQPKAPESVDRIMERIYELDEEGRQIILALLTYMTKPSKKPPRKKIE